VGYEDWWGLRSSLPLDVFIASHLAIPESLASGTSITKVARRILGGINTDNVAYSGIIEKVVEKKCMQLAC